MGMTESAPAGTTPPVEISIASPASSARCAGRPAAIRSTTGSVPGRSAARTAKPSIAELANGGRSTSAHTRLGRHAPGRVPEGHRLRREGLRTGEHERLRLLQGE